MPDPCLTWSNSMPRETGFYGVLRGSVPEVAWVVWSVANEKRAVYVTGNPYPLDRIEEARIRWWCGPIVLPPVPEGGEG